MSPEMVYPTSTFFTHGWRTHLIVTKPETIYQLSHDTESQHKYISTLQPGDLVVERGDYVIFVPANEMQRFADFHKEKTAKKSREKDGKDKAGKKPDPLIVKNGFGEYEITFAGSAVAQVQRAEYKRINQLVEGDAATWINRRYLSPSESSDLSAEKLDFPGQLLAILRQSYGQQLLPNDRMTNLYVSAVSKKAEIVAISPSPEAEEIWPVEYKFPLRNELNVFQLSKPTAG